jgi:hypothetical protein
LNKIGKHQIRLEKYPFLIGKTQREFLQKDDHRGLKNPTDARNGIMDNLGKSMRYLHEVMKDTKNLKEEEIYEIFNAQNLESFFVNLIKDTQYNPTKQNEDSIPRKYDFRTSEIARVMLELSLDYLKNSPLYLEVDSVKELSESISKDFKKLSRILLDKEDKYKTISKEQQEKSTILGREIQDKMISPRTSHIYSEIQELDFEYNELKELKLERQININRHIRDKRYKEYQKLLLENTKLKQELPEKIKETSDLQEVYRHIDSYFSSKKPLNENPNLI